MTLTASRTHAECKPRPIRCTPRFPWHQVLGSECISAALLSNGAPWCRLAAFGELLEFVLLPADGLDPTVRDIFLLGTTAVLLACRPRARAAASSLSHTAGPPPLVSLCRSSGQWPRLAHRARADPPSSKLTSMSKWL